MEGKRHRRRELWYKVDTLLPSFPSLTSLFFFFLTCLTLKKKKKKETFGCEAKDAPPVTRQFFDNYRKIYDAYMEFLEENEPSPLIRESELPPSSPPSPPPHTSSSSSYVSLSENCSHSFSPSSSSSPSFPSSSSSFPFTEEEKNNFVFVFVPGLYSGYFPG